MTNEAHRLYGMTFPIGKHRAVVITSDVLAIEENPSIAFIPGCRPEFIGFIRYARRTVPCFDLLTFCGLAKPENGERKCIISLRSDNEPVALWVPRVDSIRDFTGLSEINDNVDIPKAIAPYIVNTCHLDGETLLLLDLERLVNHLCSAPVTEY